MFMMPEMKVYLASEPTDMRKSYDGLARLIKDEIGKDVFKGELFVFMSKRKDRVKMIFPGKNGHFAKQLFWPQNQLDLNSPASNEAVCGYNTHQCIQMHVFSPPYV